LRAWLVERDGPIVALESTGVSWQPLSHIVAEVVEVVLANARDVRQRPGKKTDQADATWIAVLLAHGRIAPPVLPPPSIRALRDLTRTRVVLLHTRTHAKSRVHKVVEDPNINVAQVVCDLCGTTGRRMLEALRAGRLYPTEEQRQLQRAIQRLEQRGYAVKIECVAYYSGRLNVHC
jgi:transposase